MEVVMSRHLTSIAVIAAMLFTLGSRAIAAAAPAAPAPAPSQGQADPWPREVQGSNGATLTVFQPQIEKWDGNQLAFRAAVAATSNGSTGQVFGVIWGSARTDVDRAERTVSLRDVSISEIRFPTLPDNGSTYLGALRRALPGAMSVISLDRLEASLAIDKVRPAASVPVKNDPPRLIVSSVPALLVLIDGAPVLRPIAGTSFQRVTNTRSALFYDPSGRAYYLRVYDGWLTAPALDAPWMRGAAPAGMDATMSSLASAGLVDPLDGGDAQDKPSLAAGVPEIHVSTQPAELLVFNGKPDFQPIEGTTLLWANNTAARALVDTSDNFYYVLISGRWFRAPSLDGPWAYVPGRKLPADFARVPQSHPAAAVLASVPGTPQAEEAVIENSIPQTATVPRKGLAFTPMFDGAPQLAPIEGTSLSYVVNSPDPIIQVGTAYYAVHNGVWFMASSLTRPWSVATAIPPVIYTIPPSSPLYYATYVRVYGATPELVYVGYTPGYFGTVVSPDDVVVYGTGYAYRPWLGTVWYYGAPWTYGFGTAFDWNRLTGWSFGFGIGYPVWGPWWGPVGWGHWRWHAWGPRGGRGVASYNVYTRWGRPVHVGHAVAWGGHWAGMRGVGPYGNHVYASSEGHVYRNNSGTWQHYMPDGWHNARPPEALQHEEQARQLGESRVDAWRSAHGGEGAARGFPEFGQRRPEGSRENGFRGNEGGFHGNEGGFHGGGFHGGREHR
jgi:hypothetical protein